MLKLLFTGILLYLAYRIFFDKPILQTGNRRNKSSKPVEDIDEGEYIDYEEVD